MRILILRIVLNAILKSSRKKPAIRYTVASYIDTAAISAADLLTLCHKSYHLCN